MNTRSFRSLTVLLASFGVGCGSPTGDETSTSFTTITSSTTGDGDGDSTGDGDGDSTGDGDGDTTGDGDGDTTGDGDGDSGPDVPGGLARVEDPVVMLGAQIPGLSEVSAGDVVAFAREGGAWVQIPVQVDERAIQDFCEIYGKSSGQWTNSPACKTDLVITGLFYTDTTTFMGADPEPTLDDDDELVFMARDAGDRAGVWSEPAGVVAGSGVELELADGGDQAWVYLFEREDAGLDPGAGEDYVSYDFALENGVDYLSNYDLYGYNCGGFDAVCDPSMTEDSTIQGATYSRHFSARWVGDELRITAGDASGVDILDLDQARFSPLSCGRHVLTFSTAEGAYITNKDGPVRALRSYIGANSGPLTQRVHQFYDQREDITTYLRVHSLGAGIMSFFDYSPEASGMVYTNDLNPGGLTIDGVPDNANEDGLAEWEFVTGPQGSLVMLSGVDSTLNLNFAHAYWVDDSSPDFDQCDTSTILDAPDASAYGSSGAWLEGGLADTDPKNGSSEHLMFMRTMYFREPGLALEDAMTLIDGAKAPVEVQARTVDGAGAGVSCGDGQCEPGEEASCIYDCAPIDGSCGDGLCLPPENSTSCSTDCVGGSDMGAAVCGDGICDGAVENELLCPADCWANPFVGPVECLQDNCESLHGACADEQECVDVAVCVGGCVAQNNPANQCISDCIDQVMPSQDNADVATGLLSCGNMNNCF